MLGVSTVNSNDIQIAASVTAIDYAPTIMNVAAYIYT